MAKKPGNKKPDIKKDTTDKTDDFSVENFTTENESLRKDSTRSKNTVEKLKQDGSYVVLPDVSDIPGQENIVSAGIPGEMADTTISSDGEEGIRDGKDILEEDDDTEIVMGTEADVTAEDLALLGDPDQDLDGGEDEMVLKQGLDDTDFDGDPLNEAAVNDDSTGEDLDVPGADEKDPRKDEIGQDDEENDYYSLGGEAKEKNDEERE